MESRQLVVPRAVVAYLLVGTHVLRPPDPRIAFAPEPHVFGDERRGLHQIAAEMLDPRSAFGPQAPERPLGRVEGIDVGVEILPKPLLDARKILCAQFRRHQGASHPPRVGDAVTEVAVQMCVAIGVLVALDETRRRRQHVEDARHEIRPKILLRLPQRIRIGYGIVRAVLGKNPERKNHDFGMRAERRAKDLPPTLAGQPPTFAVGRIAIQAHVLALTSVVLVVHRKTLDAAFLRQRRQNAHVVGYRRPAGVIRPIDALVWRPIAHEEAFAKAGQAHQPPEIGNLVRKRGSLPSRLLADGVA